MKTTGSRAEVISGSALKTSGGLTKKSLKVSKVSGEVVSKKLAKAGAKNPWAIATEEARKQLGLEGKMVLMNVGPQGKKLYKLTKQLYA